MFDTQQYLRSVGLIVIMVVLMAGCLYIASYFVFLHPVEIRDELPNGDSLVVSRRVFYDAGDYPGLAEGFYKPINRLDRMIRPHYWEMSVEEYNYRRSPTKKP